MESNKPTRRSLLGAIGGSLVLAGCTGDDSDGNGDDGMDSPTVTVTSTDEYGDILAGPDGLTLYMFGADEQGATESACAGECAQNWPPLTVDGEPAAGEGVGTDLSAFERDDGSTQVAANGWPLYYWANDEEPGDTDGQGVNDVWWVLDADGTPIRGDDNGGGDSDDAGSGGGDGDDGGDDSDGGGYGGGGYG